MHQQETYWRTVRAFIQIMRRKPTGQANREQKLDANGYSSSSIANRSSGVRRNLQRTLRKRRAAFSTACRSWKNQSTAHRTPEPSARAHGGPMVKPGVVKASKTDPSSTSLGVKRTERPPDPRACNMAPQHIMQGFQRHVEIAVFQSVVAWPPPSGITQGNNFGVRAGIVIGNGGVVAASDDFSGTNHHSADGNSLWISLSATQCRPRASCSWNASIMIA